MEYFLTLSLRHCNGCPTLILKCPHPSTHNFSIRTERLSSSLIIQITEPVLRTGNGTDTGYARGRVSKTIMMADPKDWAAEVNSDRR
jgi:hypothetical protein